MSLVCSFPLIVVRESNHPSRRAPPATLHARDVRQIRPNSCHIYFSLLSISSSFSFSSVDLVSFCLLGSSAVHVSASPLTRESADHDIKCQSSNSSRLPFSSSESFPGGFLSQLSPYLVELCGCMYESMHYMYVCMYFFI